MTASRNSIFAVLALVAAIFFLFHGATVKATDQGAVQYSQHIGQQAEVSDIGAPVVGMDEPLSKVVIVGHRMSEAEKAAFDRDQS